MQNSSIKNRQNRRILTPERISFESIDDLDHLGVVTSGTSLEFIQLGPGRLKGQLAHLQLGVSSIHLNSFSLPLRGRGPLSNERWTLVAFPERVSGMFNGVELSPNIVLVFPPGKAFDGTTHGDNHHDVNFTVDDAALRQTVRRLYLQELPPSLSSCIILRPSDDPLTRLRRLAMDAFALGGRTEQSSYSDQLKASLDTSLTEQLARLLMSEHADVPREKRRVGSHLSVVRLSEHYLAAMLDKPVSISQLCEVADVSERTLRNAYRTVFGVSPKAYIKARRLQLARSRLTRSSEETETVTNIAFRSGFGHLGQFSKDYLEFFGEKPSETLAAR